MNGVLNIQTRLLTREAQAQLKALEREIDAVEKHISSQSNAQKNLNVANEHARGVTRSLAQANRELAAAERAVKASKAGIVAADKAVAAAEQARVASLAKVAAAEKKVEALAKTGLIAKAARLKMSLREKAADDALAIAKINLAAAQRRANQVKAAQALGTGNGSVGAEMAANDALEKAKIRLAAAERRVYLASKQSSVTRLEAAAAAERAAAAEEALRVAETNAAAAAETLARARASTGTASAEAAAAEQRLAAATAEVTAAQEAAVVASAAVRNAQGAAAVATAAAVGSYGGATGALRKLGSQTQWAGRQLQTNFTMPVAIAGGAAIKWALDNEKAMTRVKKVYGELELGLTPAGIKQRQDELTALGKAFELLSNHFGVQQKEVLEIASDWAAAGAAGVALAKGVQTTLSTMSLGEIEAAEATKALIAIQAQYNLSSQELTDTMAMLNIVENQTGASLSDLITGFSRAAGMANTVGVDTRHLAAYIAALTPATGSAANAGNALKTIFARLVAPTKDVRDILNAMGLSIDSVAWKNSNMTEKLEAVMQKFGGYKKAQQGVIAQTLAGTYQVSRFSELMDSLKGNVKGATHELSQYEKALQATTKPELYLKQAQDELNAVLESNPQKLKQVWVVLQNTLSRAVIPAIPFIIMLAGSIQQVFEKFQQLPPYVQKAIVAFILFAAVMGPILRLIGSFILLGSYIGKMFIGVGKGAKLLGVAFRRFLWVPIMAVVDAIGAIPLLIIAAITAIITALWFIPGVSEKIVAATTRAFNKLPAGIQRAMMAVYNIVKSVVLAVYKLFSYLNPFAHHSPSLVENVTNGMAVVVSEFAKIKDIGPPIMKAYRDIKLFKDATADLRQGLDKISRAEDLEKILKVAPGAAPAFKVLVHDLVELTKIQDVLKDKLDAQQAVVDAWEAKLQKANDALEKQHDKLSKLQEVAQGYSDKLEAAQADLDKFASAPLVGMRAMEDQIFANEQAQKALRLEMMNLEDAVGPMDDLKGRIDALNGAIDFLRGEQTSLRNAGAGSDILSFYDDQINALEDQKNAIAGTSNQYNDLQKQLDALQRTGEKLDLQKSLNFDGLLRTIDQTAHAVQELSFDQIMTGIAGAKDRIAEYSAALEIANQKVADQQEKVDAAQKKVDSINASYEVQKDKLDQISNRYEKVRDAVSDVNDALSDMISKIDAAANASKKAKEAAGGHLGNALTDFNAAAGGDFPDVGGSSGLGREGGLPEINDFIKQLEQDQADLAKRIDLFKPLREKWADFKSWWASNVGGAGGGISKMFHDLFDVGGALALEKPVTFHAYGTEFLTGFTEPTALGKAKKAMSELFMKPNTKTISHVNERTGEVSSTLLPGKEQTDLTVNINKGVDDTIKGISNALEVMGKMISLFWPDLKQMGDFLKDNMVKAWQTWKPEIERLGKALSDFWHSPVKPLINILLAMATVIAVIVVGAIKVLWAIINEVLARALDFIIDIIGDVLQVFSGLLTFLSGVFSLNFALMWQGIVDIVEGTVQAILHIFEGIGSLIWGVIWGFVQGVRDFFLWLWDVLVGHSIIPDMVNAIVDWFTGMPGRILNALAALGQKLVELIRAAWSMFMDALRSAWNGTMEFIRSLPQRIFDAFMAYVNLITSIGSKIVGFIKDGLVAEWELVKTWVGGSVKWIIDKMTGIKSSLAGAFTGMFDGIKEAFRSAVNFVINGWNSLSFGIPGFDPPGPGSFPGFTVSVPHISPLATGGTAQKNMPYVVGEVGPEFFLPGVTGRVVANNDIASLMSKATSDAISSLQASPLSGTVKGLSPAALAGAADAAAARAATGTTSAQPVQNTTVNNTVEYHFHGDLSFPNIKSGEDAETFITNLSDLAG